MQELFQLVRRLVDIPSVTGGEGRCGEFLAEWLKGAGFRVDLQEVSPGRLNVAAALGRPEVVLSTHMDTVGPFFASGEDAEWITGRGSCDAKGILASQLVAARALKQEGLGDFGLLFLVGEEAVSDGARAANACSPGSRFLLMGEPTSNRLVTATKGILQVRFRTRGRAAHSAYPDRGESAIEKLLDVLADLRAMPLPRDPELGSTTMNVGLLAGGVAPNVTPPDAEATALFRTVTGPAGLIAQIEQVVAGRAAVEVVRAGGPTRLVRLEGFESDVVAFTTDVPHLDRWGRPLLVGPGSILNAHSAEERVSKAELVRAVELYRQLVVHLKANGAAGAGARETEGAPL